LTALLCAFFHKAAKISSPKYVILVMKREFYGIKGLTIGGLEDKLLNELCNP